MTYLPSFLPFAFPALPRARAWVFILCPIKEVSYERWPAIQLYRVAHDSHLVPRLLSPPRLSPRLFPRCPVYCLPNPATLLDYLDYLCYLLHLFYLCFHWFPLASVSAHLRSLSPNWPRRCPQTPPQPCPALSVLPTSEPLFPHLSLRLSRRLAASPHMASAADRSDTSGVSTPALGMPRTASAPQTVTPADVVSANASPSTSPRHTGNGSDTSSPSAIPAFRQNGHKSCDACKMRKVKCPSMSLSRVPFLFFFFSFCLCFLFLPSFLY